MSLIQRKDDGTFRDVLEDRADGADEIRALSKAAASAVPKPEGDRTATDRRLLAAMADGRPIEEIQRLGSFASVRDTTDYLVALDLEATVEYLARRHEIEQEARAAQKADLAETFAQPVVKSAPASGGGYFFGTDGRVAR